MAQVYRMDTAKVLGESVNRNVIESLKAQLGAARYEEVAEELTFKLAGRLGKLDRTLRQGDLAACNRHARNVFGIACAIGMTGVERVARDAMACACRDDLDGLSAVVARLNWVAEASLFAVFEVDM